MTKTNFSKLIVDNYGDQVYENDEELFNDISIFDEDKNLVKINGISNQWGFNRIEVSKFVAGLNWQIGNDDYTKKKQSLAEKRLDELFDRVEPVLSKRLGRKIKVLLIDNDEEPGEYEEIETY